MYIYKVLKCKKVIYVGITGNPTLRMYQHKQDSEWYGIQDEIKVISVKNLETAKVYEKILINFYMAEYNIENLGVIDIEPLNFKDNFKWVDINSVCQKIKKKKKKDASAKIECFYYNGIKGILKDIVIKLSTLTRGINHWDRDYNIINNHFTIGKTKRNIEIQTEDNQDFKLSAVIKDIKYNKSSYKDKYVYIINSRDSPTVRDYLRDNYSSLENAK